MAYEIDPKEVEKGMVIVNRLGLLDRANPSLGEDLRLHTLSIFAKIWSRDTIVIEERSMITLTALIALNRENELRLHLRGARNLGISREKIEEIILHLAHYAGWPCAVSASEVLDEVWAEMDAEQA